MQTGKELKRILTQKGTDMNFFRDLAFLASGLFILSKHDATHGKPVTFQSQKGLLFSACAKVSAQVNVTTGPYFSRRSKQSGANNESENRQKVVQCSHLGKAGLEH